MKNKDDNSRKMIRRSLLFYLTIRNADTEQPIGELGDLTEKGLLIISEDLLDQGAKMETLLDMPKGPSYPKEPLPLSIEVQWSRKDPDNPELYLAGCRIVEVQKQEVISLLIEKIGFSHGQRKVFFDEVEPDFR